MLALGEHFSFVHLSQGRTAFRGAERARRKLKYSLGDPEIKQQLMIIF